MINTYILNDYKGSKPTITDDFYGNINFDWLKSNKIPDDEDKYTHFIETQYNINDKLKKILESNLFPLGTILYNSYLNYTYRDKNCLNELKDILNIVDIIKNYEDIIIMNGRLLFINVNVLFDANVDTNVYSSCNTILYITQPSLGLSNRIYYHDEKYRNIKQKYYEMICSIYKELYPIYTNDEINTISSLILNIETKLSIIFLDNTEQRETDQIYNKIKLVNAINRYPKLYIRSFIQTLCTLADDSIIYENFSSIIMEHHKKESINYFKQLELLIESYSINEWKEYFKFKIIINYFNLTNSKMRELHFNLYKKTIRGQQKPKLNWRSALSYTSNQLNDSISRIYVHNYFSNKIEEYIIEMVKFIKRATKKRITQLDWMSNKTKEKALLKLHKMKLKIGYSKSIPRNYEHIILTNSLIKNTIILNRDNYIYNLNKINSTVNPDDWDLPAYMVNAYYNPTRNEIIFPASILQSPFFDLNKSHIYNYANIGSVIGHEIIHGFDDQGSKYDENGTINNWWTESDYKKYNVKVNRIIEIYNNEGINGKLTAGENIADFGAVILPLFALEYKLKRKLTESDIKEFYMAYATHWQYLLTKQSAEERKLSDPHAFADLRVNIPLKHQKLFQKVFNINEGNKLYVKLEDILTIW